MSNIFDLFKKIETQRDTTPVSVIIAGLGNPGTQYEKTRHNVGFIAIDYIAEKLGVRIDRAKFHALVAEAKLGNVRVLLMKPQTYMNNSGVAIQEAAAFYKIPAERVIVLHDEISFEPGIIRIRR
jgi:PTH1 family peptidyl-tRNA hydrolase